jgi:hypothetical protein
MAKVTTEQNSQYPGATVSGIKQPFNIGVVRHRAEIAQIRAWTGNLFTAYTDSPQKP